MIKIIFNEEDISALRYWRFQHPDPRVQVRMEALYLRSQGVANAEILRLCGMSKASFHRHLKAYVAGGIEQLKRIDHYRPHSELANHRTTPRSLLSSASAGDRGGSGGQNRRADRHCAQAHSGAAVFAGAGDETDESRHAPGQGRRGSPRSIKKAWSPGYRQLGLASAPSFSLMRPTLCSRPFRYGLVFPTAVCQSALWAATGECVGGLECDHPQDLDGPESDVNYR